MASPRCQSRDSSGRCPSNESVHSNREEPVMNPLLSALPPNFPPAAFLPQHSAAMAAYLNAAAAAAHQNRLLLASPLANLQRGRSPSPENVLDFSQKRRQSNDSDSNDGSDGEAQNLSAPVKMENSPLDLSCSRRKASSPRKLVLDPVAPSLPYFANERSPNKQLLNSWNGKKNHQMIPNEAKNALEKMSELSGMSPSNPSGRTGKQSAWQSHWLNKGANSAKDVLKCVWCKQSFTSMGAMTAHMKDNKHCGVSMPPQANFHQNHQQNHQNQQQSAPPRSNAGTASSKLDSSKSNASKLNFLFKDSMPLPRKLVRGQDIWLGRGAEQTRQILKCMWCGQSFQTLTDMTQHMQETQHYTNILSQEQIISWKTGSSDASGEKGAQTPAAGANNASNNNNMSHISAVLTCKVCDLSFSSLKELSNHMVKNAHYKEHVMRSINESGSRRKQTREKRKKSLPVRKLLELERSQYDDSNSFTNKLVKDSGAGKISCEKCNEKIETLMFVEHIRQCVGNVKEDELMLSPIPRQRSASSLNLSIDSSKDKSSSKSSLNALEMLIEKSFDTRSRSETQNSASASQSSTPLGASILKRLGIDESVDYTKPLMDSQTMSLLRNYHSQQNYLAAHFGRQERSGSESSSISERGSSRVDSLTPEKKFDMSGGSRISPDKYLHDSDQDERPMKIKIERNEQEDGEDIQEKLKQARIQNFRIKREVEDEEESPNKRKQSESDDDRPLKLIKLSNLTNNQSPQASPAPSRSASSVPISPATSPTSPISDHHSSIASRSTPGDKNEKKATGSLGALSSMFDSLGSSEKLSNGQNKRSKANPLAALQKLCDKNEKNTHRGSGQSTKFVANSIN